MPESECKGDVDVVRKHEAEKHRKTIHGECESDTNIGMAGEKKS